MPRVKYLRKQRPNNTSFRQALDLSTSPCDLHKFHNIRLFIRQQIDKHYDYSLPYMLQTATTVATFEAELNAVLPELYSTEWRKKQTSHYVETHFRNSLWLMQRDLQSKAKNVEDDNESTSSITSADSTAVSEDIPLALARAPPVRVPAPRIVAAPQKPVQKFLRACQPSLERLLPLFVSLGIRTQEDLAGVMRWPPLKRHAWLKELRREEEWQEFGLTRMNVQSLSLAFQDSEQVKAVLLVR